jgi:hypothetical protein
MIMSVRASLSIVLSLTLLTRAASGFTGTAPSRQSTFSGMLFMNSDNKKKKTRAKPQGFAGAVLRDLQTSRFPYAGDVRPGQQTPQKVVLDESIVKPDYWQTGAPSRPSKLALPWMIEVKSPEEIEKMRASGKLAREILDLAGRAVQPGVTTDEIDQIVHQAILKVRNKTASRQFLWRTGDLFGCMLTVSVRFLFRSPIIAFVLDFGFRLEPTPHH